MDDGRIWIDIETSAGVKVGGGPITSATRWRNVRRLSRAGTFEFEMPAGDPMANNLALKRIVRCWGLVDGAVAELGAGIIDEIALQPKPGSATMLQVRGDDLLRELTYRTVGALALSEDNQRTADGVYLWDKSTSFTALTNAYDGNAGTEAAVNQTTGLVLLIGDANPFDRVQFNIGTPPNSATTPLYMSYYNGIDPESNTGFVAHPISSDGTASSGATMAVDGVVSFETPTDWIKTSLNGQNLYWVYFWMPTTVSFDLAEVDCISGNVPSSTALADVIALAPSGWALDTVDGYGTTTNDVFAKFTGQSVLQALIAIADATGEHFILGSGRTVRWLRTDTPAAPVRGVAESMPSAGTDLAAELAIIRSLERTYNSFDVVTRVYPFGDALADGSFVSLEQSSDSAPSGYTLSTASNYLEHDAGAIAYGQIERTIYWREIKPATETSEDVTTAANALLAMAAAYLAQNSAPYEQYRVALLTREILTPGMLLNVVFDQWSDGYHAVSIDADLVILETTIEIDAQGMRTTQLEVATAAVWSQSDQVLLARALTAQSGKDQAAVWQT